MEQIVSCRVEVCEMLTFGRVLELYDLCNASTSAVYFANGEEVCKHTDLTKLVLFFLSLNDPVLIIIKGRDASHMLDDILQLLQEDVVLHEEKIDNQHSLMNG